MAYDDENPYKPMFFAKYWQLRKLQADTNPNIIFEKAFDVFLTAYQVDYVANVFHNDIAITTCEGMVIPQVKSDDTVNFHCVTCSIRFDLTLRIDLVTNDTVVHEDFRLE